jgi:hypothetical protein
VLRGRRSARRRRCRSWRRWDGVAEMWRDGRYWDRAAQLTAASVSSGSINSQQGGSLQKM